MAIEHKFITDSILKYNISVFLEESLEKAGFSRVDIQKTPMITRITVYVLNPGRVIGKGGRTIDALTESVRTKFGMQNPQISIMGIDNKMLEPLLVAKDIAQKLERGINFRKIVQGTLRSIIENGGAIGAEIIIGGKLAAKNAKAKSMKKRVGYIPKSGHIVDLVREDHATALTKYGTIGIKVRIVPPGTVFPGSDMKKIAMPKSIMHS
ncbi:MAG: 30S ribosomal protein S3 [Candidatus Marsarchaeota archaeon]|jgi:small subunit ribosomal protein S3|nr:30S ribosomal protein S3 [Candidatus Marsarchaeota archaeon]